MSASDVKKRLNKVMPIMGIVAFILILLLYYGMVTMPESAKTDSITRFSSPVLEAEKYSVLPLKQLETPTLPVEQPVIVRKEHKPEMFYVSVTSENLSETLQSLTAVIPAKEGKQYTIRLHVTATDVE